MSSGLRESRAFHRRNRRKRQAKWLFVISSLFGLGLFAYYSGSELARLEVVQLREEIERLTRLVDNLRHENAGLQSGIEGARTAEAEWRARYQKEVPTGERRVLLAQLDEQIAAGASTERLRFLIGNASSADECAGTPETKRFLARTPGAPIINAAVASVGFANGAIVVTANGEPALSPDGKPQAWFDPAQSVTVQFTDLAGKRTKVAGVLPLQHSVVLKNTEYRFNVMEGDRRGFVNVTSDACAFP